MTNAELILQHCIAANAPQTAKQILDACFPGKPQPYINSTINLLVSRKELVRDDVVRPYTVRVPRDGEPIPEPRDYSRAKSYAPPISPEAIPRFSEADLEETALRVEADPRYGEEATIIKHCLRKFPENKDSDVIAMKIALIDMTNSTNLNKHLGKIFLTELIEKIKGSNFDQRVAAGDVSLISELAQGTVNLFSFFSKYCLYHNFYIYQKDDFVIFDGVMQRHIGAFLSQFEYNGRIYPSARIPACIEAMRRNYDYASYLKLIDYILEANEIHCPNKHRKFDWFVWYNHR